MWHWNPLRCRPVIWWLNRKSSNHECFNTFDWFETYMTWKMASHSHVVVYHGPLLSHLLGVALSTFTTVYPFEVNQTQTFLSEIILLATATRKQGHRLFSVYFNLRPRNLPWHRISTCDRQVHMLKEVQAASDKQKKKVCSCLPQERWIPPTIQRLVLQCFWWWCQGMHLQATQLQTSW